MTSERAGAQIAWDVSGQTTAVSVFDVEAEGETSAALRLVASYIVSRNWNFILQLEAEQVYAWHFRPGGACESAISDDVSGEGTQAELDTAEIERLEPAMTNDPKDRHVLAAAVAAGSEIVVTLSVADFPPEACDPVGV